MEAVFLAGAFLAAAFLAGAFLAAAGAFFATFFLATFHSSEKRKTGVVRCRLVKQLNRCDLTFSPIQNTRRQPLRMMEEDTSLCVLNHHLTGGSTTEPKSMTSSCTKLAEHCNMFSTNFAQNSDTFFCDDKSSEKVSSARTSFEALDSIDHRRFCGDESSIA